MNYVRVKSYAKINLTLDLLGVSGGYHMLDSVVASVDIFDVIEAKRRRDGLCGVTMHGMGSESIPPERNNALKAAERFVSAFGTTGADITVRKNIPVGAGLGGSSADVAGVLNALAKLYNVTDRARVKAVADGLGSDCGYMLTGGYARISGRGEIVKPIDAKCVFDIGLIVSDSGVSTAECYALYDSLNVRGAHTSDGAEAALIAGNVRALGESLSNGLILAAARLNGDIEGNIGELRSFDPCGVNMTGSGSGVYALFENDQFLRYARSRSKKKIIMTRTVVPAKEE